MKRFIVIEYDPNTAYAGDPIDLFSYLVNELDNAGIAAKMVEHKVNPADVRTRP